MEHVPVLAEDVVKLLLTRVDDNSVYVDCTLGGGGHAESILRRMGRKGRLVAIDWDESAIEISKERLKDFGDRVLFVRDNFKNLRSILEDLSLKEVDGVLFDLGLSSFQLEIPQRGFSFKLNGPLDMRMDQRIEKRAYDIVNFTPVRDLEEIIRRYGEEPSARRIAKLIAEERSKDSIATTWQLKEIVERVYRKAGSRRKVHFAARTFQALRIVVNNELSNLEEGLSDSIGFLRKGGRVVVISFHSLEDRIVKNLFRKLSGICLCPPHFPVCNCGSRKEIRVLTKRPVVPSEEEVFFNPKARSAKLRAAEKIG